MAYDIVIKSDDEAITYASYSRAGGGGSGGSNDVYIVVDTLAELRALTGDDAEDAVLLLGDRGGWFTWTSGDQSALVTADPGEGQTVAGAGVVSGASGAWVRNFSGEYQAAWWGVDASASGADNQVALTRALSKVAADGGGVLRLPRGVVTIALSAAIDALNIGSKVTLKGDGDASVLRFVPNSGVTSVNLMQFSGERPSLQNVKITGVFDSTHSGNAIIFGSGANQASDVYIAGMHLDLEGVLATAHIVHGIQFSTDLDGFVLENFTIQRCRYGLLKGSTNTSNQTRIALRNGMFKNNTKGNCNFNTPSGVIDDVEVSGVRFFRDADYHDGDQDQGGLGGAKATNFRFSDLHMEGTMNDALHFEEGAGPGTVTNVTAKLTGHNFSYGGSGIVLLENDVSGADLTPGEITFANCHMVRTGTTTVTANAGFRVVTVSGANAGAERLSLQGCYMEGFERGYELGDLIDLRADGNIAHNCNVVGLRAERIEGLDGGFLISDTPLGVETNQGGVAKGVSFHNVDTLGSSAAGTLILRDYSVQFDRTSVAGSSAYTWFRVAQDVDEAFALASLNAYGSMGSSYEITQLDFNGTVADLTVEQAIDSGSLNGTFALISELRTSGISAAGTGYAIDDVLTISGGTNTTGGTDSTVTVTSVGGSGEITGVSVTNPGEYTIGSEPSSPNSATGGGGSGASISLTMGFAAAFRVFNSGATGDVLVSAAISHDIAVS